ncbi:hypothetical protein ALNOE001_11110 [Candidatus Methanobinarius endosymbioticus]|uniref:Uncharacterized protein n=1 Tax=Candidatus Methanobinarius endosymbioticus TaxID=2006182 RepID=A0A366MCH7_9EURY|nr:hypothetical protein ALNOE001_11110 [Candidatus Methanobinarius endosymbioticus]
MKYNIIFKIGFLLLFLFLSVNFVSAEGNFSSLQNDINNSGSELILDKNYTYNPSEDT